MADETENKPAAKPGPEWKGTLSADKPLVGPDGHVHLSEEDIKARDKNG